MALLVTVTDNFILTAHVTFWSEESGSFDHTADNFILAVCVTS